MRRLLIFFSLWILAAASLPAEDKPTTREVIPPLRDQPIAASLLEVAGKEGIRWQSDRLPSEQAQPREGDSVVVLAGSSDGTILRQWLLQLRRVAVRPADKEDGDHQISYFSCWGPVSVFNANPEPLEVTVIGPVQVSPQPAPGKAPKLQVRRSRVLVPGAFMRLGLDGTARSCIHLMESAHRLAVEDPSFQGTSLWSRTTPISSEEIRHYKPIAAKLGWTVEDERLFAGGMVSLQSFYEVARSEPVLWDLAMTVINRPSVWAMAKVLMGAGPSTNFMLNDNLCVLKPSDAGVLESGAPTYQVPFEMNLQGKPLVGCFMVVTHPVPPLDVSAGIVALVAYHPKDFKKVIELRLLGFGL